VLLEAVAELDVRPTVDPTVVPPKTCKGPPFFVVVVVVAFVSLVVDSPWAAAIGIGEPPRDEEDGVQN